MKCEECEKMLAAYAAGDLEAGEIEAVEQHLACCSDCQEALTAYQSVIELIAAEPILGPNPAESASLASALERVPLRVQSSRPMNPRSVREFVGFLAATIAVFAFMVIVLGLQVFGRIDILWMLSSVNPLSIVLTAVVVVFVTSFIPIWVTARRRPLNGLTFGR